jgi:hypothetical protein
VKGLARRVGLYRVAAILIGFALVLEVVRVKVLEGSTAGTVACTLGEVVFLGLAAGFFIIARRRGA